MKGLELAENFYNEYGLPMLENEFPELLPRIAAGLTGEGSECLGFDDDISRDHDFEHGFCMFLTEDDEKKYGFKLMRAYNKLPQEYMGFKKPGVNPAGGARHGVFLIHEFYARILGRVPKSLSDWLVLPSYALKTATSGKIFTDNLGEFTKIRDYLKKGYPEDVRLKKLAACAMAMSQDGQYNYIRCAARDERGAAALALNLFVRRAVSTVYLLNKEYEPFYKWTFRGMRKLPLLAELEEPLVYLTEGENTKSDADGKREIIEAIAHSIIGEYNNQGLTMATCNNLDTHARSITDHINDGNLRNGNIFAGL